MNEKANRVCSVDIVGSGYPFFYLWNAVGEDQDLTFHPLCFAMSAARFGENSESVGAEAALGMESGG